ncbi:MAG: hypothetical protein JW725_05010, partial [Candidatus Babeliaceae bacterium]|nr:hypothetical protein [Candidatus Babeliaceae bacterium]
WGLTTDRSLKPRLTRAGELFWRLSRKLLSDTRCRLLASIAFLKSLDGLTDHLTQFSWIFPASPPGIKFLSCDPGKSLQVRLTLLWHPQHVVSITS